MIVDHPEPFTRVVAIEQALKVGVAPVRKFLERFDLEYSGPIEFAPMGFFHELHLVEYLSALNFPKGAPMKLTRESQRDGIQAHSIMAGCAFAVYDLCADRAFRQFGFRQNVSRNHHELFGRGKLSVLFAPQSDALSSAGEFIRGSAYVHPNVEICTRRIAFSNYKQQ